ncbi:MAG: hypothetical protein SOT07_00330 [Paludibacteraceae bacterium]|nr:hypothetical protein [Paludibacteraceae bacterium]
MSPISSYYGTMEGGRLQAAGTLTQESDAGVTRRQAMRLRTNPNRHEKHIPPFLYHFLYHFLYSNHPLRPRPGGGFTCQ